MIDAEKSTMQAQVNRRAIQLPEWVNLKGESANKFKQFVAGWPSLPLQKQKQHAVFYKYVLRDCGQFHS